MLLFDYVIIINHTGIKADYADIKDKIKQIWIHKHGTHIKNSWYRLSKGCNRAVTNGNANYFHFVILCFQLSDIAQKCIPPTVGSDVIWAPWHSKSSQLDRLLNSLVRLATMKILKLCISGLLWAETTGNWWTAGFTTPPPDLATHTLTPHPRPYPYPYPRTPTFNPRNEESFSMSWCHPDSNTIAGLTI